MNLLLDTHAFLWWVTNDPRLSAAAGVAIADDQNSVYVSTATAWEIAIKAGLGQLRLPAEPASFIARQVALNAFEILPVQLGHALHVLTLPALHRDPFDRMLVAQSQVESLALVTSDAAIRAYAVATVW